MRLALVFPPSMPPTSPPCGIAYLKAFIPCKAFDVNLTYHDTAVHMVQKGDLCVEATIGKDVLEPENLREAVDFLKGPIYDPEEYNTSMTIFFSYFTEISNYVRRECMKYGEGSPRDDVLDIMDRVISPVKRYHPDAVGFSQMVLDQREFILGLAQNLKLEGIPLLLGGASLSYNPEAYLSVVSGLDLSDIFDAVFYGEGELPLKAYAEGEPFEKISYLVYRRETIIKNRETGIDDLDELPPPDFSDFPLKDYYASEIILPLLTSRGCYWRRCTFCRHHTSYYRYRTRSCEKVLSDLRELQKKYEASYFLFADEMVHPQRFDELSRLIIEEGLNVRFYAEVKPTRDFNRNLLKGMYQSGARALLWGVESGTQRILDLMDKGTKVGDIEQVLKDSHEAGIWNMIFMIERFPTQTKKEVEEDFAFLRRNEPYLSTVTGSSFKLEVGSRLYESPEQFGIKKVEEPSYVFSPVCEYLNPLFTDQEADFLSKRYSTEFIVLSKVSWYFARMRDHMLLMADHLSENPLERRAP